jgi:pimeloyl-ACP methyl ester carboxylesterase
MTTEPAPPRLDPRRGRLIEALAAIEPQKGGQLAFRLFCTPPRRPQEMAMEARLVAAMTPLIDKAQRIDSTSEGRRIVAYRWPATVSDPRGRVLLVHGWTARAMVMGLFVGPLRNAGFEVVAMDMPGHGLSEGRMLNMPIGARAIHAVADVAGPFTGAIAHSFGGPSLALAVEGGAPIGRKLALDRLVTISSPNRLADMLASFARQHALSPTTVALMTTEVEAAAGRPVPAVQVGTFLATAGTPALVIHDRGDDEVPFERATSICDACPNAALLATDGLGHSRIVITPSTVRAAVRFLTGG